MSVVDFPEEADLESLNIPAPEPSTAFPSNPLDYPKELKGWILDLIKTEISVEDLVGSAGTLVPIGGIILWEETDLPDGFIELNGAVIDAGLYPKLASMRANAPDYRGMVPVGYSSGDPDFGTLGGTTGVKTVTLTSAQSGLPAHTHTASLSVAPLSDSTHNLAFPAGGTNWGFVIGATITVNNNTAANAASSHTNIQPSRATRFIMRAR